MDFLRRMSTRSEPLDEEQIKQLRHQRRRSSIAIDEDLVLPSAITPPVQIFPNSTSTRQETLLISPDPTAKGFVITSAGTGNHLLTVATAAPSVPGPSHTKYFYGELTFANGEPDVRRNDSEGSTTSSHSCYSGKLCTLVRDVISFRRRHHVDDPHNGQRLLEIEFTTSSWEAGQLKAAICLLNKYNDLGPIEPVELRWKGRKTSLEGVLEWNNKPAAVCAKGEETDKGQYVLYAAPGMDLYVACIVVMAVDDRTR